MRALAHQSCEAPDPRPAGGGPDGADGPHRPPLSAALAAEPGLLKAIALAGAQDETVQRQLARMQAELDAYKAALDQHVIVAITDLKGRITHVNQPFCAISGYSCDELIGQRHSIVNSGHHPRSFFVEMWQKIVQGGIWRAEICNKAKAGHLYWVDTTIVPFRNEAKEIGGFMSIRYDITKRKQAEALLLDIIETIPGGVAAFDEKERLILFNRAYRDYHDGIADRLMLGMRFEEIVDLVVGRDQVRLAGNSPERKTAWKDARIRAFRRPTRPHTQQLADGTWLQVQERRSASGHTVSVRTDITELKNAEITIKKQAERDSLTGLYNRSVLNDALERACERTKRTGQSGALVIADLDGFKCVNDTLGHDAGDRLLIEIAGRLKTALRASDILVRLGGDEFAFILSRVAGPAALEKLLKRMVRAVKEPLTIASRTIEPRCSFGACLFPGEARSKGDLVRSADIALYEAKATNRGGYRIFHTGMRRKVEEREKLAARLEAEIGTERIDIALQPQVGLADQRHTGFEALARWSRNGRQVSPQAFIPVAEETGLIVDLGRAIIERAISAARRMRDRGFDYGVIAVNIAAAQLRTDGFVEEIAACLARHDVAPASFEIEITENVLLDRAPEKIRAALEGLKKLGVLISLDDFGTGYASLTHLKQFPLDRLKIDRSFVRDSTSDPGDAAICRATVGLAHSLGLQVVAEGIETAEQSAFLASLGCDFGQGYLFGKPLQGAALTQYVDARMATGCRPAT